MKKILIIMTCLITLGWNAYSSNSQTCEELFGGTWHVCSYDDIYIINDIIQESDCEGDVLNIYLVLVPC
jgi:hypothetical protein